MRYILTAVPDRIETVKYLQSKIPNLEIIWDQQRDAMDTFLRSMKATGYSPAVHLEDDVVLTSNFCEKIEQAIKDKPKDLIQFFSMRKADLEIGSRYDRNFMMNQCYYTPPFWCAQFLQWLNAIAPTFQEIKAKWNNGYDTMMNDYLKSIKSPYWIHVPSLVDHRVGKSMIDARRGSTNRQSKTFIP